jgi:hypothetical protein
MQCMCQSPDSKVRSGQSAEEEAGMWEIFQRNRALGGMVEISAEHLSVFMEPLCSKLIILDLRRRDEVEQYPRIIPGALLTAGMDVPALIDWLPPQTLLVLYATDRIPRSCSRLHLLRNDLSFYVLSGGLRAWWRADLAMETVDLDSVRARARD